MVCDVANELVSPPPRPGLRNVGLGNRREGYLLGQDRGRLPSPYGTIGITVNNQLRGARLR